MQPTPDRLLLRPAEAANLLAISRSKLYSLLASGEVPRVLVGKSLRVPRAALERWIEEREVASRLRPLPPLGIPAIPPTRAKRRGTR